MGHCKENGLDAAREYEADLVRDWEARTGRIALPPGEHSGVHAAEALIGSPDRLLEPEEQARLRAMHGNLADNIKYWTRSYGADRAAELVRRLYDANGDFVVDPDTTQPATNVAHVSK